MNHQKQVRQEYRSILSALVKLSASQPQVREVLTGFRVGWLTPGGEILERLEHHRLGLRAVWQRPVELQQKWFADLTNDEKARWISLFWDSPAKNQLPKILGLSKRRLLQVLQVRNALRTFHPKGTVACDRESPKPQKMSGEIDEVKSPKVRSSARVGRRTVGG